MQSSPSRICPDMEHIFSAYWHRIQVDLIQVVSKMVTFDPNVRISVADTLRLKCIPQRCHGSVWTCFHWTTPRVGDRFPFGFPSNFSQKVPKLLTTPRSTCTQRFSLWETGLSLPLGTQKRSLSLCGSNVQDRSGARYFDHLFEEEDLVHDTCVRLKCDRPIFRNFQLVCSQNEKGIVSLLSRVLLYCQCFINEQQVSSAHYIAFCRALELHVPARAGMLLSGTVLLHLPSSQQYSIIPVGSRKEQ